MMRDPRQRFVYEGGAVSKIMDTKDNSVVCYMQTKDRSRDKTEIMARIMTAALNIESLRRDTAARNAPVQGTLPTD